MVIVAHLRATIAEAISFRTYVHRYAKPLQCHPNILHHSGDREGLLAVEAETRHGTYLSGLLWHRRHWARILPAIIDDIEMRRPVFLALSAPLMMIITIMLSPFLPGVFVDLGRYV
ncbi:unnamed protein product, partial [Musa textilis]